MRLQCGHGLIAVEMYLICYVCHTPTKGLQCGHGLIAVEILAAEVTEGVPVPLQCGHGLIAVEMGLVAAGVRAALEGPSMRPRPDSRGDARSSCWTNRTV